MSVGTNLDGLREHNASLVLDVIRREPGISRSTIARRVDLTRQAVAKIVSRLAEEGLIRSDGAVADGVGAPREHLSVVRDARCAIGVTVDRTGWRVVIVDLYGEPSARSAGSYPTVPAPAQLVGDLAVAVRDVIRRSGVDPRRVVGLGAGVVGPLDAVRGIVTDATNFGAWHDVPLAAQLRAATGLECRIEKDTNAAAIGEHWRLPGTENDALVVYAGSGIGAGLLLGGSVYTGSTGNAGEFGHMRLVPDGPVCVCGRRGCVETVASQAAVVASLPDDAAAREVPVGWRHDTATRFASIADRAVAGDRACADAIRSAGRMLGIAVANVLQLLDLPTVILTGPTIAGAGELYAHAAVRAITDDARHTGRPPARVRVSTLGGDVVDLGAAILGFGNPGSPLARIVR